MLRDYFILQGSCLAVTSMITEEDNIEAANGHPEEFLLVL